MPFFLSYARHECFTRVAKVFKLRRCSRRRHLETVPLFKSSSSSVKPSKGQSLVQITLYTAPIYLRGWQIFAGRDKPLAQHKL
jgi:hypothetical protein